jgi:alpha-glucosidase (family GH31 glycosyl hydrolase)
VIRLRYYLLPHLYTLFALQSMTGSTVARPVWHEFPREPATLDLDTQFLLGPGLMICPVLEEAAVGRDCYFPTGIWYEGYDLERTGPGGWLEGRAEEHAVALPLDRTGVFFRPGPVSP